MFWSSLIIFIFAFSELVFVSGEPCSTAIIASGNCGSQSIGECTKYFFWSGTFARQCVVVGSPPYCGGIDPPCDPPCFPPGRNPVSMCSLGNANSSYCSTLTSKSDLRYCQWISGTCQAGPACNNYLRNCPTATVQLPSCSTTNRTYCENGFIRPGSVNPIEQCMWNSVTQVCKQSTVRCIPPCMLPGKIAGGCNTASGQTVCGNSVAPVGTGTGLGTFCVWVPGRPGRSPRCTTAGGLQCHF